MDAVGSRAVPVGDAQRTIASVVENLQRVVHAPEDTFGSSCSAWSPRAT